MILINTVDSKYFTLDGVRFARIYQPLAQGSAAIGIYNIYDTRQQLKNSTDFNEFAVDGVTYGTQAETVVAILSVIWSGISDTDVEQLEQRVDNIEENQYSGVIVYSTYAELPTSGTLLVSYKVSNDPNTALNGYYHWSGSAYIKDADPNTGVIEAGNVDATSGDTVYEGIAFAQKDEALFVNDFSDNGFNVGLFEYVSGAGSFEYVEYNGIRTLHVTNCIVKADFDFANVDLAKNWSFAMFINSLATGGSNARIVASTLNDAGATIGTGYDENYNGTFSDAVVLSDNYVLDPTAAKFRIFIDCIDEEIYCSNFFIGNAPYSKFVPYDSNLIAIDKLSYRNVIPNNIYSNGLYGWEDSGMPTGTNLGVTISLESESSPFNSVVRRATATTGGASSFSGIAVRVGNDFKDGDTVVFRGLFKKSVGTLQNWIEVRAKDAALATLETVQTPNYTESTTDWLESGNIEITLPALTEWIVIFVRNITSAEHIDFSGWTLTKKTSFLSDVYLITESKEDSYIYHVSKTGSDSNEGTESSPFETINKAITESAGKASSKIAINGGDYRETVNFALLNGSEDIEIIAKQSELVRILGSTALSGIVKTAGRTNIYEAAFIGTVLDYPHEAGKMIFEDGRSSKPILATEVEALQRGLENRLPYSEMKEEAFDTDLSTTLANLDLNAGKFYHDGSVLYFHATDSDSPLTNGFSYEVAERETTGKTSGINSINLRFIDLRFMFSSSNGFEAGQCNSIYRMNCSCFGAFGDGFSDDTMKAVTYKDESAGSANDGINGHYNVLSGWLTTDLRIGCNQSFYFDAWCHDNYDDGISFHERGEFTCDGGLYEYNGDRGIAPASGCNFIGKNVFARKNGQQVPVDVGAVGEGFSCVNPAVDGRNGTSALLFNCSSQDNQKGFAVKDDAGNKMTLVSCISRNNIVAELDAEDGTITSKNTLATGTNLKVISGTGVITIENDTLLI